LNWRPQEHTIKTTQPSRVPRTQEGQASMNSPTKSFKEKSNRCTECKRQEHHKDAPIPHSQVPTKLLKLLGEQERRNQIGTQNPPKSRSRKIHSQRDVLVWSKHGSRSPLSSTQIWARIIGGEEINK